GMGGGLRRRGDAGAVPAPINSFGLGNELRSALQSVAPSVLCCDSDRLKRLEGDPGVPGCHVVRVGEPVESRHDAQDYHTLIQGPQHALPEVHLAPDDPALILFTSGATSQAKGVLSSQRAVCQALTNIDYIGAISAMSSPRTIQRIMQSGHEPTTLTAVPLFHVSGLHAQLLTALSKGRRLVFLHRWDTREALELMRVEQVTQFNGAPSMVRQLLAEEEFFDPAIQDVLMGLGFGGAGLPESLIDRVLTRMPEKLLGIGYGMTESNGVCAAISGDLFKSNPTSSGLISPLMQVRIASADDAELPNGEVGEICLRGAALMQGYWSGNGVSRQALADGWLHTGDLGYRDDQGFLYVVDRLKDIINRSGENIAAAEVESCLMTHPAVIEAAVFGVPDPDTDEAVMAVVSVAPEWDPNPQALRRHVADAWRGTRCR
uniref:class I adenylate-forming enzyme family protein n=1 Tax=Halomonas sp. PR-M31 TaxID=1471202 RepID=UPI000B031C9C